MFDVIDFMERMGGDAQLSQASSNELAVALADTGIPAELQSALLARDARQVEVLLGTNTVCMLVAPPVPPGPPGSPYHTPLLPPPPLLPEEEWEQYQREH